MRRSAPALLAALAASASAAAPAGATISSATTIDGPSADLVDVGGVAMSSDGTGGIVYRKRVDGRVHVFAAQFAGGRWRAPQRVDAGQAFDSSWPVLGAADGGRLVVAWVQEAGAADRLFGATLAPGSARFGEPVPIDLNVGDPVALHPHLAVSRGGAAYLTYVVAEEDPNLRQGTVRGELRLARYGGQLWSTLGFPLNRNPSAPLRRPTELTGPRATIDAAGNGALVWQEPDDDQVDRIWSRRLFGATTGIPVQVSPGTYDGRPLRGPADAFSADVSGFGQTVVAFRQQSAPGSALAGTRVLTATLPETFTQEAAKVQGPVLVDGEPAGQAPPQPEPPAVASVPGGQFAVAYGVGTSTVLVASGEDGLQRPQRVDTAASSVTSTPFVDAAASGATALVFRRQAGGRGGVVVREVRSDGVEETRTLSASRGGVVEALDVAGSGLGDVLAGWQQGTRAGAQVAAAVVDAPPDDFAVDTPADFVTRRDLLLRWDAPANAIGGLRYTVTVDDETVVEDLARTRLPLAAKALPEGVSIVSVIARDDAGQETSSAPAELKVDGRAPRARIRAARGLRASVRLTDGAPRAASGIAADTVRIAWGDGRRSTGEAAATHRYRRPGRYAVVVRAADAAGNRRRARRTVTVR